MQAVGKRVGAAAASNSPNKRGRPETGPRVIDLKDGVPAEAEKGNGADKTWRSRIEVVLRRHQC